MKTYEVISEGIFAGQRIAPPGPVALTDEQAEWGRSAGVIGDEVDGGDPETPENPETPEVPETPEPETPKPTAKAKAKAGK